MTKFATRLTAIALTTAAFIGIANSAFAQTWPTKPVKIVVPFPPGGSNDTIARILGAQMTQNTGQQFIVENRPGASGSLGTGVVAKGAADGYTFVLVFDTHGVNPTLIPGMPFDTLKDLAPVMLLGTSPMALVTWPDSQYKTFAQLLAAAKASSGSVAFGSIGSGSLGHLAFAQIGNLAGTEFNHIPYKGGGPLLTDALGGQVPTAIGTVFLVNPHVETKKLVPLVVTSKNRAPSMPNVPTLAESGFPGFEALSWWGLFAPAATPPAIVARMNEELTKAMATPAIREKLAGQGMEIIASSPDRLQTFLKSEIDRWAKVIQQNKIKPD